MTNGLRLFFNRMKWVAGILALAAALVPTPARAQLNGENLLGDHGVASGSQPLPGWYATGLYYRYSADTIRKSDGSQLALDPTQPASQTIHAFVPLVLYVSPAKLFGANYGAMIAPSFANGSLEAPAFGFESSAGTGAGDLYVVPLQLGWHLRRADVTTSFGFYAPTGRYTAGASDNIGKGMWSYELSGGTTLYFDPERSVSFATTAYWETHTAKEGTEVTVGRTTLTGVKVGQLLTLEGGLGKSFMKGAVSVGAAYYAQWKVTDDEFGFSITPPGGALLGKHHVVAFGPDVTVPLATKSVLIALVNLRYFWETSAVLKTEGQSLLVTATFPIPSVRLR